MKQFFIAVIIAILALLSYQIVNSQSLTADLYGGIANYQGDLQSKRFSFNNIGPAAGLGISYHFNSKWTVRGVATYMKIKGSDASNSGDKSNLAGRNLSFKSSVWEAQLAVEYNFFDIS